MGQPSYKLVTSDGDMRAAFAVRRQVFVEEQGISEELVFDDRDGKALHMVVKNRDTVVGTARVLLLADKRAKLERMAILRPFRRKGIGSGVISFLNGELRKRQIEQVVLHAQSEAVAFYRSCGFEESGLPFWEAGMKHRKMLRRTRDSEAQSA